MRPAHVQNRTPSGHQFASEDAATRFVRKVVDEGDGGCWQWIGHIDRVGCGRFWFEGRMDEAHRVAYRLFVGEIPAKWVVRQKCNNRACVNPQHLEVAEKPRPRQPASLRPWAAIYGMPEWKTAREAALLRDGHRCTVARFLRGDCTGRLHVHHVIPLEDGGEPFELDNLGTACSRHHPMWEALRRRVVESLADDLRHAIQCRHRHATAEARRLCEERRIREVAAKYRRRPDSLAA